MKKYIWILIGIIVVVAIVVGITGYSNTCSKFPHPCGRCDTKIFGITFFSNVIECASNPPDNLVGGCGGVYYTYWNECCENRATENNVFHNQCAGNWTVEDNVCKWICD